MSLFKKLAEKLAGESGELKKIRADAEKRRGAKSSQSIPAVQDGVVIDKAINSLSKRIGSNEYTKPKNIPGPDKKPPSK